MTARVPKQRTVGWLFVPAGIALVASGVFAGRMSARPAPLTAVHEVEAPSKAADDRRFAVLEQELLRLRAEVAATAQKERRELGQEPTEREPASEGTVDPEEAEHAAEAERFEFLDDLAYRVDTEPRDAGFGAQTEPVISRLLPRHLGPDVQVSDVACGSSICRAKVTHPGSPRLSEDRLADFMLQRESLGEMSVQLDLRDEGVTTLYFIRGDG